MNQICKISGSLNGPQNEIDKLIAAKQDLVVDFSECTFISVPGLEWLTDMLTRANTAGVEVTYTSVPPVLYKVFKIARIENILNACGSPATPPTGSVC